MARRPITLIHPFRTAYIVTLIRNYFLFFFFITFIHSKSSHQKPKTKTHIPTRPKHHITCASHRPPIWCVGACVCVYVRVCVCALRARTQHTLANRTPPPLRHSRHPLACVGRSKTAQMARIHIYYAEFLRSLWLIAARTGPSRPEMPRYYSKTKPPPHILSKHTHIRY